MKRSEKLEYISFAEMTVDIKCALSSKLNEWFDPDLVPDPEDFKTESE